MSVTTFNKQAAVTPNDSTNFNEESAIYIGVSGDVAVELWGKSNSEIYLSVPIGFMPMNVRKVLSTGTTATNIIRGFN